MNTLEQVLDHCEFLWRQTTERRHPLTDIQWRVDRCKPGSILFFQRFDDGRSDLEILQRYLAHGTFSVLVTNRKMECFSSLPDIDICVTKPDAWSAVVGRFCDLVYPVRTDGPGFLGVTGTNGKTTTVRFLDAILRDRGHRVLCIGTLGIALDGQTVENLGFTSPPQIELRRLIHAYQDLADWIVMEVSSHALDQGRADGILLEAAAWTNFTLDHLDYHRDEAAYFAAKARILDMIRPGGRLYTTSADVAKDIANRAPSDVPVELIEPPSLDPQALAAKPFLALEHNRANYALAAALARVALGGEEGSFWRSLDPVPGRFDCRVVGNRTFVIDFAHTPDGLESILTAIRQAYPGAQVATLFGCGGDRDKGKRPLMGAVAARHSDLLILTSDNPRFESPRAIVADILAGIEHNTPRVILDRAAAIADLVERIAERPASEPWVALIAGKGHERYIDQNGHKTPYNDQDELEKNLPRLS